MRLYLDVTKSLKQRHSSGLRRMASGLELGLRSIDRCELRLCRWSIPRFGYVELASGSPFNWKEGSIFITPEVFAPSERWGHDRWLKRFQGCSATVYYDAIPFTHPEITWPRSVRRFQPWFRALKTYRKAYYISASAKSEAEAIARMLQTALPVGKVVFPGANYREHPLNRSVNRAQPPVLLSTGILEPRKGYIELCAALEALWKDGLRFKWVVLGRVNPHFGQPIVDTIGRMQSVGMDIVHEPSADDEQLAKWHACASMVIQSSHAEGFGLPILEALWAGCPVLCSQQPALECVDGSCGVSVVKEVTPEALKRAIEPFLQCPEKLCALENEVRKTSLPTWETSAESLFSDLYAKGSLKS
jgi:glycosyltransferase involved in cell wall biosynthesis